MTRATFRKAAPRIRIAMALGAASLLQACAASSEYPSLARRTAERVEGSGTPAAGATQAPALLPPATADLSARLNGLLSAARQANARFEARRPSAERAVASAGAVSGETWTSAQVALSDLQAARSGAVTALAELDQLYVNARADYPAQVSPAAAAIATARDEVQGWVESQDATIDRLGRRLKG